MNIWFAAIVVAVTASVASISAEAAPSPTTVSTAPTETAAQRDARMKWWREARFGMFIHWGIYSVPAGTYQGKQIPSIGEWIMNNGEIPVAEYAKFAGEFNPTEFDAEKFAALAKRAGMKYVVITSKHHDGFAMFGSKASPYNIVDATPFKRDVIKELGDAVRKQGLQFGVYYSQAQDWHHPGGLAIKRGSRPNAHWDPAQEGSFDEYLTNIAIPQVRELLTNYGPMAVLWWDTPVNTTPQQAVRLHELLALQPQIISNNRLGGGFKGDTETPEQRIPATGFPGGRDWETCMTMNDTWGYKSYDNKYKSAEQLLRNLIDIASKGGNYLLNVGPTAQGTIPPPQVERLEQIGRWLDKNGEAIYATSASPFPTRPAWGRATQKAGKLYLHIFTWPGDGKLAVPMLNGGAKAYLLSDPSKSLNVVRGDSGTTIELPPAAPDAIASVIVVEVNGAVELAPTPAPATTTTTATATTKPAQ